MNSEFTMGNMWRRLKAADSRLLITILANMCESIAHGHNVIHAIKLGAIVTETFVCV